MIEIKTFRNGVVISRGRGSFDDWQISVDGYPPRDQDYFRQLLRFSDNVGIDTVYDDFYSIYRQTTANIDTQTLDNLIPKIAGTYDDEEEVEVLLTTIYCTMIAEENKANTKLGKRIKGLAVYQILRENMGVIDACNFSRGRSWREIARLCDERGL